MGANETAANTEREWTVMVYMSSDNALASDCVWGLTEMQNSNFDRNKIAVVAQFDPPAKGIGTLQYDFTINQRANAKMRLERSQYKLNTPLGLVVDEVQGHKIPERPIEKAFAHPNVLEGFIKSGIIRYPAKRYAVILSGLGNGVLDGLLADNNPMGEMKITELHTALTTVKDELQVYLQHATNGKIDILGFDCCLMGMVELASELSDVASYIIASEGLVPGTGWPYRQVLETISNNSSAATEGVASEIKNSYIDYYSEYIIAGISVDQSVCDLSKIEALETAIRELVEILICEVEYEDLGIKEYKLKSEFIDSLILAHWKAQSFRSDQHVDLWDFCHCLRESCDVGAVKNACGNVKTIVESVVKKSNTANSGGAFQHSHGLSIYFPWAISELSLINEYKNLKFADQTWWGVFLDIYVKDTQRELSNAKAKDKWLVFPPDYYFIGQDAPRLPDAQVLTRGRDSEIAPKVRDSEVAPKVRDVKLLAGVRDSEVAPKVRDSEIAPKVRDSEIAPKVRDSEIAPKVRDLVLGMGLLAPKVKNPPTYFYKRPLEDESESARG